MKFAALVLALLMSTQVSARISFSYHDFPPFSYPEDGEGKGIMIDMLRLVCFELAQKCDFQYYPNRRSKKYMELGLVSGNIPLGWNKKRSQWMYFSIPLLTTSYSFYGQVNDDFSYRDLPDLEGKKIGVFGPSNTQNTLEIIRASMIEAGLSPITIEVRPNADAHGLVMLARGRADLRFINRDVAELRLKNQNIKGVEEKGKYKSLEYFAGFSKEHTKTEFMIRINRAILKLYHNDGFKPVWKKWDIAPGNIKESKLNELEILH